MNDPGSDDRAPLAIDEWPYIQVADRIEKRIRDGEFGEHGQLPGVPRSLSGTGWASRLPGTRVGS
jgi:hypothetical protein